MTGNVKLNVTFRGVRVINVAVEKQKAFHILSVRCLSYPACNEHVPLLYCHMWPDWLYNFTHYLINGMIFKGWGDVI